MKRKLLLLGGKPIGSCEIVERANSLGIETVVADYLPPEESPAKRVASRAWAVSTGDIDTLEHLCREESVDAVLAGVHEFNIERMIDLASRLGAPCYCTEDQWAACEDKSAFKDLCRSHGIDVAGEWSPEEALLLPPDRYPLAVKPRDGSGSRGFTKVRRPADLADAIERARSASPTGSVLVEEFIESDAAIVHYTVSGGEVIYSGMADKLSMRLPGGAPVMALQVAPSRFEGRYLEEVDAKATEMVRSLGLRDCPVWIEVFCTGNRFVFNETGLRFGGSMTPHLVKWSSGIDQVDLLIDAAMGERHVASSCRRRAKGVYGILPTHLRPGRIGRVDGLEALPSIPGFVAEARVHYPGDVIEDWGSAQQVFSYLHFASGDFDGLMRSMARAMEVLSVSSDEGDEMLFSLFDPADPGAAVTGSEMLSAWMGGH